MRIIHCADIHLDAKMTANLPAEKAKERRLEILGTFRRMIDFAVADHVDAVLIAGDLYDKKTCSAAFRNTIISLIKEQPQIAFFYLKGNHDVDPIFRGKEDGIPNLHLFSSDRWNSYYLGDSKVRITGRELTAADSVVAYEELELKKEDYNIVMLHGQVADRHASVHASQKGTGAVIPLKSLEKKEIDYLALGHVHKPMSGRLDGRAVYCYPGCLEGRGFDECGEHGCLLVDIDPETHKTDVVMVPLAGRRLYELSVDISNCSNSQEMLRKIEQSLEESSFESRDLIRITLTGEVELSSEIMAEYLNKQLEHLFYYLKVENATKVKVDYRKYLTDPSLKGEFVRRVGQEDELSEEEKAEVIRLGIRLLMGVDGFEDY